jgi:serine/threonine protein kinase
MAFVPEKGGEPIPGYQLIDRLGVGGYGEVWKASAPGGLLKAIKIVYGKIGDAWAEQEMRALSRMKEVRHPFLLSLERFEIIHEQLLIVTEVADRSLMDRFAQCRAEGMLGIPRDEMLGYMRDAADALDYMNESFGLQHQDIKPQNLLILSGRVKVADFGLVKNLAGTSVSATGGVTPIYAPPEAFDGRVSRFSDQYSLSIVYQEMLTGVRPFPGSTALQLATQHTSSPPLLHPLPPSDRPVIARALAKVPEQRYPTCRAMAEALGRARTSSGARPAAPPAFVPSPQPVLPSPPRPAPKPITELPHRTSAPKGPPPDSKFDTATLLSSRPDTSSMSEVRSTPCPVSGPLAARPNPQTSMRPTLFVGLGGLAGKTLRQLRRQLVHDLERSEGLLPEFLLIDTDRPALLATLEGSYDEAFDAANILHVPLRRPEHHRDHAADLLRWLDRRWLYGIPRSQLTEGIRPLGRLALVDNADEVMSRVKQALDRLLQPPTATGGAPSLASTATLPPRVFLIASATGGSGGGMLVDLAYAIRQRLREMDLPPDDICGVLLYGTGRKPTTRELARFNAIATLRELNHFHRPEIRFPGETQIGVNPLGCTEPAFSETYFLHMGDELGDTQAGKEAEVELDRAAHRAAEYLRLNVVTRIAPLVEQFREQTRQKPTDEDPHLRLRTVSVCRMTFPRNKLANLMGNLLSQHVVQRWRNLDPRESKNAQEETSRRAASWGIEPEALARHFCSSVESVWGMPPDAQFQQLLEATPLAKGPMPKQPELGQQVREVVRAIDTLLDDGSGGKTMSLCQTLLHGRGRELCANLGKAVVDWLVGLVEDADHRVLRAERAGQALALDLIAKTERAQERLVQVLARRDLLRQQLLSPDLIDRSGGVRRLIASSLGQDTAQGPLQMLFEYCWVRLTALAWERTLDVLGAVSRHLADFRENLVLCQQQLRHISEHFVRMQQVLTPEQSQESPAPGIVELLPGQAANLPLAAAGLMERLPREAIEDFERHFQAEVLGPRGGLMALATDHGTLIEHIKRSLEARTVSAAHEQVARVDAAQLFLEQCGSPEVVKEKLGDLLKHASSALDVSQAWRHVLLAVPDSLPGDLLRDLVVGLHPECAITSVESDGDVIICLEAANLHCGHTANSLLGDRTPPREILDRLQTRTDVDWTPIEVGACEVG